MVFSNEEVQRSSIRWKLAMVGKFLGPRLPIDFVRKEMKLRWNTEREFHVSSLSKGMLLSVCPSKEVKDRILQKRP